MAPNSCGNPPSYRAREPRDRYDFVRGQVHQNRGQGALEYLMSYGWAIGIIILLGGALYSLGVFDPTTWVAGKRATGFHSFEVKDWKVAASGSSGPAGYYAAEVDFQFTEPNLDTFKFNWNGTNYTFYDSSLVFAMNFNNNSAIGENDTKAVDISQYGNNGTVNGSAWVLGKFSSALRFDGVDDRVFKSAPAIASKTITAWIKFTSTDVIRGIIFSNSNNYHLLATGASGRRFATIPSSVAGAGVQTINTYNDGQWHFVVALRDTNEIYVDGINVTTQADTNNYAAVDTNIVEIGRRSPIYSFNGTVDEVRIYNRALSASEIRMHYRSELSRYNQTSWRFYNNITNLTEGAYTYYGWENDTVGNSNQVGSGTVSFTPRRGALTLVLGNKYGEPLTITSINATRSGSSASCSLASMNLPVSEGQEVTLTTAEGSCATGLTSGKEYSLDTKIYFSSLSGISHVESGTITGKVE